MKIRNRKNALQSFGTLWGVGVGPGDPELLTCQALRVLDATSIVVYPISFNGTSLARQIAATVLKDYHTEIALRLCFNGDRTLIKAAYNQVATLISLYLLKGQDVAVLCEGDPLFFGSFTHIMTRMDGRFPIRIVPGVNSLSACSSIILQPLALADEQVAIIPAFRPAREIIETLSSVEVCAIIKIGRYLETVINILNYLGLLEKSWYIEHAGQLDQRACPLTFVTEKKSVPYFSTVLVHKCRNHTLDTEFSY